MRKKITITVSIIVLVIAGSVLAWFYRGKIFKTSGKFEITVTRNLTAEQRQIYLDRIKKGEDFLKTLKSNQSDYQIQAENTYLYLGEQYYGLGSLSRAEEKFQTALSFGQKTLEADVYTALALSQTERGDYAAARLSLEKAKELAPNRADIWLSYIALIKDRFPENQKGIPSFFEQALTATNRHLDIITAFARYKEEIGDTAGALLLWKEAMGKDPSNSAYKQEYQRLGGR